MLARDLKLKENGYSFSCNLYPARSHYKIIMTLGRVFPSTLAQAQFFVRNRFTLDVLNAEDVAIIERILNNHNFLGDYNYTQSHRWARLNNYSDLYKALKLEYHA